MGCIQRCLRGQRCRLPAARNPEESLLYQVVAGELETFLAAQQDNERQVPGFIEKEFRSFLDCGVLARGFLRIACNNLFLYQFTLSPKNFL